MTADRTNLDLVIEFINNGYDSMTDAGKTVFAKTCMNIGINVKEPVTEAEFERVSEIIIKKMEDEEMVDTTAATIEYEEVTIADKAKEVAENAKEKLGISMEKLFIEPGRSIVAEAGITLYTIGGFKNTYSKKYLFIDGGMCDNIRPALYQAKYNCDIANRMDEEADFVCDLVGRCCESGDIIQPEIDLPAATCRGDIIAVCTTGAYNYSMASNYNRLPRPAMVMLTEDRSYLAIRRETLDDLVMLDV